MSWLFSGGTVLFLLYLAALFLSQSLPVWRQEGINYLTGTKWFYRQHVFGTLPMLYGTLAVSGIALAVAAPLGLGAALCSAEILPSRFRLVVKALIELLAGIPSVVYGLLGILFLREWVYEAFAPFDLASGDTVLTAGLLLAVMVLPTVMTLADDALRGVPAAQRLAARGLGLTRAETVFSTVLPQAAPGVAAAILLGFGRAVGETIAVFLVIGRQDNQWPEDLFSLHPMLESGQTLTTKLGGAEINIAYGDPVHWAAMCGLSLILLFLVGMVTWVGARLLGRFHS